MAESSQELKKQMRDEDEVWGYLQDVERGARYEGQKEGETIGLEKGRAELQENRVINNKFFSEDLH